MKRFYCTVCKKVKRVRKFPLTISNYTTAINPVDRIGECNRHSDSFRQGKSKAQKDFASFNKLSITEIKPLKSSKRGK